MGTSCVIPLADTRAQPLAAMVIAPAKARPRIAARSCDRPDRSAMRSRLGARWCKAGTSGGAFAVQVDTGHVRSPFSQLRVVGDQGKRRADEVRTGSPRQRQPEQRAIAGFPPGLKPSAMYPGVLERNREAEASAAGASRPGRIGPPEPVEHRSEEH